MIFNTKATQKNACQKLADISLTKGKSNELWSELDETSQAAVSGGYWPYFSSAGIESYYNVSLTKFTDIRYQETKLEIGVLRQEVRGRRKELEEVCTNMRCSRGNTYISASIFQLLPQKLDCWG